MLGVCKSRCFMMFLFQPNEPASKIYFYGVSKRVTPLQLKTKSAAE